MIRALRLTPLLLAVLLAAPAPAAAHAEFESSTPADGATLDAPPEEVVIVFSGELDPEASGFAVTDADGAEVGQGKVDLDVAERNELRGTVDIDGPGTYTVAWTVAAEDGHPDEGTFSFTVADPDASPAEAPDTAMSEPTTQIPLQLIGGGLLVAAAAVGLVRWQGRARSR